MTFNRRTLVAAACIVATTGLPLARAQGYPSKPLRIVVPWPPGGSNDVLGRVLGQKLSESMG